MLNTSYIISHLKKILYIIVTQNIIFICKILPIIERTEKYHLIVIGMVLGI